ncbi:MAG TPA: hypothetical protein VFS08_04915 [Gemmatimonadaceae bacterium]|nr:hypothetical protein [Gemmatimonadaceae bacterium]
MRDILTDLTPRRGFLTRLAAAGAALGATMHGRALAAQTATPAPAAPPSQPTPGWDLSWVDRLTSSHRQVFDAPELADGVVLHQASAWLKGYTDVYGTKDGDANAVLVIRHFAIPMVMNDAMWDRYELGAGMAQFAADKQPVKDPASGQPARRNPFLNANNKPGDKYTSMYIWPDGGLDTLMQRGATVLACNLALAYLATNVMAPKDGTTPEAALANVKQNLLPGVIVMPSGIFAVSRAQEAGCRYIYSV